MTECDEEIREFLVESRENLEALDRQIVELERAPSDDETVASVFRTIHTLKGTSDFLGFHGISSIAHVLESLLAQVRDHLRPLTPALVSLVLEALDAIQQILRTIEQDRKEGLDCWEPLRERLGAVYKARISEEMSQPGITFSIGSDLPQVEPRLDQPMRPDRDPYGMDRFEGTRETDRAARSTIRVDVLLLDRMSTLVDRLDSINGPLSQRDLQADGEGEGGDRNQAIVRELHECLMLARMQPIGVIWNKFPRAVRDVALEMGKIIEVQMDGALTELDRNIIEAISDPFTHMVRNACDHGIECPQVRVAKGKKPQGTILLRAMVEDGWVILQISDDGAGMDVESIKAKALQKGLIDLERAHSMTNQEALRLIFLPGLSTAKSISNVSGRGVGMDVVKTNIEAIHGAIDIASVMDVGTTITITIPARLESLADNQMRVELAALCSA